MKMVFVLCLVFCVLCFVSLLSPAFVRWIPLGVVLGGVGDIVFVYFIQDGFTASKDGVGE